MIVKLLGQLTRARRARRARRSPPKSPSRLRYSVIVRLESKAPIGIPVLTRREVNSMAGALGFVQLRCLCEDGHPSL